MLTGHHPLRGRRAPERRCAVSSRTTPHRHPRSSTASRRAWICCSENGLAKDRDERIQDAETFAKLLPIVEREGGRHPRHADHAGPSQACALAVEGDLPVGRRRRPRDRPPRLGLDRVAKIGRPPRPTPPRARTRSPFSLSRTSRARRTSITSPRASAPPSSRSSRSSSDCACCRAPKPGVWTSSISARAKWRPEARCRRSARGQSASRRRPSPRFGQLDGRRATATVVWSGTIVRPRDQVFALQAEIASRVAAALEIQLSPAERERLSRDPTRSAQAYDHYLRGRDALDTGRQRTSVPGRDRAGDPPPRAGPWCSIPGSPSPTPGSPRHGGSNTSASLDPGDLDAAAADAERALELDPSLPAAIVGARPRAAQQRAAVGLHRSVGGALSSGTPSPPSPTGSWPSRTTRSGGSKKRRMRCAWRRRSTPTTGGSGSS